MKFVGLKLYFYSNFQKVWLLLGKIFQNWSSWKNLKFNIARNLFTENQLLSELSKPARAEDFDSIALKGRFLA